MAFEELINGETRLNHRAKINNNFAKATEKEAGKSLVLDSEITKLAALPTNANLNTALGLKEDKAVVDSINTRLTNAETKLVQDKGYYLTSAALIAAHPAPADGSFARVEETDTIWQWDTDANVWRNTDTVGAGATPLATNAEELAGIVTNKASTPGGRTSWWTAIKALVQTISAKWTFTGGINTSVAEFFEQSALPSPIADVEQLFAIDVGGITSLRAQSPTGLVTDIFRDDSIICRNETGVTIPKGTPVYVVGASSGSFGLPPTRIPLVAPCRANALATMPCIGITMQSIANNSQGRVMEIGMITDIDTSAFTANARLFISSSTAGAFTSTAPIDFVQRVAIVIRSHASNGQILVNIGPLRVVAEGSLVRSGGSAGQVQTKASNADWDIVWTTPTVYAPLNLTVDPKSGNYTLVEGDNGKVIEVSALATITLPNGLSTGFRCDIVRTGSGEVTLSASTTLRNGTANKIKTQYQAASVYHAGSNIWQAIGTEV